MSSPETSVSAKVDSAIITIRGYKVLLDADLAPLYGVSVKALNQAVKRNLLRFPVDFMFELTVEEVQSLRSQIVTSSSWGGRRYLPRAFTEQGVAMLSQRAPQRTSRAGQRRDHACFRTPTPAAPTERGSIPQAQRTRKEIRRSIPRRLRRDPGVDGPAGEATATHRVPRRQAERVTTHDARNGALPDCAERLRRKLLRIN